MANLQASIHATKLHSQYFCLICFPEGTQTYNEVFQTPCRDAKCIREAYSKRGLSKFVPQPSKGNTTTSITELGLQVPIKEIQCGGAQEAATAVLQRFRRNSTKTPREPFLLRGCANALPAVAKWTNDDYLKQHNKKASNGQKPFDVIFANNEDATDYSAEVPEQLRGDIAENRTLFGRILQSEFVEERT